MRLPLASTSHCTACSKAHCLHLTPPSGTFWCACICPYDAHRLLTGCKQVCYKIVAQGLCVDVESQAYTRCCHWSTTPVAPTAATYLSVTSPFSELLEILRKVSMYALQNVLTIWDWSMLTLCCVVDCITETDMHACQANSKHRRSCH